MTDTSKSANNFGCKQIASTDYRKRLTANANDFDSIVMDILNENHKLKERIAELEKDAGWIKVGRVHPPMIHGMKFLVKCDGEPYIAYYDNCGVFHGDGDKIFFGNCDKPNYTHWKYIDRAIANQ